MNEENDVKRHKSKLVYFFIAVSLPIFTLSIYFLIGSPKIIFQPVKLENTITTNSGEVIDLDHAVSLLEARIKENPNDFQANYLLIKTLISLSRLHEALAKLKNLQINDANNIELLILEANIYIKMANGIIDNKTKNLIVKIENINSNHHILYWLKGVLANQENDFLAAKNYFELSLKNTTDPERIAELEKLIRLNDLDLKIIVTNN